MNIQAPPPNPPPNPPTVSPTFEEQILTLYQYLMNNRNLVFPPGIPARRIYDQFNNRLRTRVTTMRGLLCFIVSMHAQTVQINDEFVTRRVADKLLLTANRQEKTQYNILASQVNSIIRRN
ncbi:hypothetical protein C1645_842078 [Glomus cerebriforme]|uniref:Uncharacterized protein n=1 Tax=Glomus cerebriforme TaxID=658196 RepID=A0A397RX39_9GLOM|nr:hypothetical protein C1645_842078 [Glomus cerebriforme]